MMFGPRNNPQGGVALVTALIITTVVFLLIMSTLYVITMSTNISGAGKRYATCSEAADGGVEVMKEVINLTMFGDPISSLDISGTTSGTTTLTDVIMGFGTSTSIDTLTITLPSTGLLSRFSLNVTLERLYDIISPGGTPRFPPEVGGGGGSHGIYYRISTTCEGPNNTKAETTVVYRYVQ
jgi:hypothetical protein